MHPTALPPPISTVTLECATPEVVDAYERIMAQQPEFDEAADRACRRMEWQLGAPDGSLRLAVLRTLVLGFATANGHRFDPRVVPGCWRVAPGRPHEIWPAAGAAGRSARELVDQLRSQWPVRELERVIGVPPATSGRVAEMPVSCRLDGNVLEVGCDESGYEELVVNLSRCVVRGDWVRSK